MAFEAINLLMRVDRLLCEARADWNQDRFRRLMRCRARAVVRVRRPGGTSQPISWSGTCGVAPAFPC